MYFGVIYVIVRNNKEKGSNLMKIDFHTHAFNDVIAERAIKKLLSVEPSLVNYTDGTIADLVAKLKEWGTDIGVLLPIATKPSQQTVINDWASEVQKKYPSIISFGSVHPRADDVFEELERIKALGLRGIKFHPDYQDFFIDDEDIFPVYEKCAELKLVVIFHGGYDPLSPELIHTMPDASLRAHKAVPDMTMVLAHFGGMYKWDDVEKYLVGEDIYFDTAFVGGEISDEQYERIIKAHGADKVLLGSDCPWQKTSKEVEFIERLNLTAEEKELIYFKNAKRLLMID